MAKGSVLKGALAAMPKGLQRMSPGVYRNPQGQLVGGQGQSLPNQRPQRPSMQVPQPNRMPMNPGNQMSGIAAGMGSGIGAAFGGKPYPQQPGMVYAGGNPNFNEMSGQYNPSLAAITQASLAAQQQFGQMPQGQQSPMQDLMYRSPAGTQVPDLSQVNGLPQQPQYQSSTEPQAYFDAQRQAFNQQMSTGNNLARMQPNGKIAY
jgi:hypothetical protein